MIDCRIGSGYCSGYSPGLLKGKMLRGIDVSLKVMRVARLNSFQPIGELRAEKNCPTDWVRRYKSVRVAVGFGSRTEKRSTVHG